MEANKKKEGSPLTSPKQTSSEVNSRCKDIKTLPILNESLEADEFMKYINKKIEYHNRLVKTEAKLYVQQEIIYLIREILPIIYKNTSVLFCEIGTYAIRAYHKAIEKNCNGLILYLPISDKYESKPKIVVLNCRDCIIPERGNIMIKPKAFDILNLDGSGVENIDFFILPIDELKNYGL
jgi:hypothetical protein